MLHEEITKDIIGAAMAVLNELKPGLDEKLYENALVIERTTARSSTHWATCGNRLLTGMPLCPCC